MLISKSYRTALGGNIYAGFRLLFLGFHCEEVKPTWQSMLLKQALTPAPFTGRGDKRLDSSFLWKDK